MARVGYARVSTQDQRLDLQVDALRAAGCSKIFEEKASGYKGPRPQFDAMDAYVHEGDTLVVWKLDRLGRSTMQLMQYVNGLQERGVDFVSLQDAIDTTTPAGKFFFTVMIIVVVKYTKGTDNLFLSYKSRYGCNSRSPLSETKRFKYKCRSISHFSQK